MNQYAVYLLLAIPVILIVIWALVRWFDRREEQH